MVNYNDSSRTLSGIDERSIVSLQLPSSVTAISIGGDVGKPGQVIAKNNITNDLEWDEVDDITIPDGSITGLKLAPNITFTTTGNISLLKLSKFSRKTYGFKEKGNRFLILKLLIFL